MQKKRNVPQDIVDEKDENLQVNSAPITHFLKQYKIPVLLFVPRCSDEC